MHLSVSHLGRFTRLQALCQHVRDYDYSNVSDARLRFPSRFNIALIAAALDGYHDRQWVLDVFQHGLRTGFDASRFGRPWEEFDDVPEARGLREYREQVDDHLRTLIANGNALEPMTLAQLKQLCGDRGAITQLSSVPKGVDKRRVVCWFNLSGVNDAVPGDMVRGVRYPTSTDLLADRSSCHALRVDDLASAYNQLLLHFADWPGMVFKHQLPEAPEGAVYIVQNSLAFGLNSACMSFQRVINAFCWAIERWVPGVKRAISYIDDRAIAIEAGHDPLDVSMAALAFMRACGWVDSPDKARGAAAQVEFLGQEVHIDGWRALTSAKIAKYTAACRELVSAAHAPVRRKRVEEVVGQLSWAACCCPRARLMLFPLHRWLARTRRRAELSWQCVRSLEWFANAMARWPPLQLRGDYGDASCAPPLVVFTDACTTGFGGVLGDFYVAGTWREEEHAPDTMAQQEALAVAYTLAAAAEAGLMRGRMVHVYTDSTPTCWLLRKWSSQSAAMHKAGLLLANVLAGEGARLKSFHCPGVANVLADTASRLNGAPPTGPLAQLRRLQVPEAVRGTRWASPSLTLPTWPY
eukprot:PLAT11641.2.p1 GENE.PLAT11641.2~~PLAT11641.2.p1  ORF type:complete len:581 (-),score=49.46 PLAT11641.2:1248-2990(-)